MKGKLSVFTKIVVFSLLLFFSVTIIQMSFQFNELKQEKEQLEKDIKEYQIKVDELKSQLDEKFDDSYIMRIARDKLGYRLPEEIVFYNDYSK